jgi:cell division protein FtsB
LVCGHLASIEVVVIAALSCLAARARRDRRALRINSTMRSSHTFSLWLVRALGVFAIVLAWSLFLGPYGFRNLHDQHESVAERSERVFERIQANRGLEQRLDALQNDPRALDAELRASQNWVRPGEVMIVLPQETGGSR